MRPSNVVYSRRGSSRRLPKWDIDLAATVALFLSSQIVTMQVSVAGSIRSNMPILVIRIPQATTS